MKFARRLRSFLIGVGLGCILVVFFFHDRLNLLTDWLPNERVLVRLQMTEAAYTPEAMCRLECLGLDTADVSLLKREGNVRFKLSDTRTEPKRYRVDHRFGDHLVRMTFDADEIASTLTEVDRPNAPVACPCD